MSPPDLILLVVAVCGFILALSLALLRAGWWIRTTTSQVRSQLARTHRYTSDQTELFQLLISKLISENVISDDNYMQQVVRMYAARHSDEINLILKEERQALNPLNRRELARLEALIFKIERAETFRDSDIKDYFVLVTKLKEGKSETNPGVAALVTVGELLLPLTVTNSVPPLVHTSSPRQAPVKAHGARNVLSWMVGTPNEAMVLRWGALSGFAFLTLLPWAILFDLTIWTLVIVLLGLVATLRILLRTVEKQLLESFFSYCTQLVDSPEKPLFEYETRVTLTRKILEFQAARNLLPQLPVLLPRLRALAQSHSSWDDHYYEWQMVLSKLTALSRKRP